MSFLTVVSGAFGWIYTLLWSLSFYPQPLLNWRRGSTSGTTIDFPALNVLGFLAYFVSNAAFLFAPQVRREYGRRHHGLTPTVRINDFVFAAHALAVCCLTLTQFVPRLWGFTRRGRAEAGARLSRSVLGVMVGSGLGVVAVAVIVAARKDEDAATGWAWIDVIYAVSYVKLLITVVKYMPQVLTNVRNRSTAGWAIGQILLDFAGGLLSLAQLAIDSYLQRDWSGLTGNPVKFALANVSIFFDILFIFQHYVWYRGGTKGDGEEEEGERAPLLSD